MTLYWHVHHDVLMEEMEGGENGLAARIAFIRANKPAEEIETRLRLMRPLSPQSAAALKSANDAYDAALKSARDAMKSASAAIFAAMKSASDAYGAAMKSSHENDCPNCPWDGRTIFPEASA